MNSFCRRNLDWEWGLICHHWIFCQIHVALGSGSAVTNFIFCLDAHLPSLVLWVAVNLKKKKKKTPPQKKNVFDWFLMVALTRLYLISVPTWLFDVYYIGEWEEFPLLFGCCYCYKTGSIILDWVLSESRAILWLGTSINLIYRERRLAWGQSCDW